MRLLEAPFAFLRGFDFASALAVCGYRCCASCEGEPRRSRNEACCEIERFRQGFDSFIL